MNEQKVDAGVSPASLSTRRSFYKPKADIGMSIIFQRITKSVIAIGLCLMSLFSCSKEEGKYIIFLHNRFLETNDLSESHLEYGQVDYLGIISAFEEGGLKVISEIRSGNVNAREYAAKVVGQIDSLISIGIEPGDITVIGTSKGGYIAQYVSTIAENSELNFVFIACFRKEDIENIPEINLCGNILNIYESSDAFGESALERKTTSTCEIVHFKELELNTGMGHGFLFKPLEEWLKPTIDWANGRF